MTGDTEKYCPSCHKVLPLEAFRLSANKPKGRDAYCKACRRQKTISNRAVENARWTRYRKAKAAVGETLGDQTLLPIKRRARAKARYHHAEHQTCIMPRCANRGVRHHYRGYTGTDATAIIFLCQKHHAFEHILERARTASKPTYF